jgi:Fe-S cluster biogenesis protein NfuA
MNNSEFQSRMEHIEQVVQRVNALSDADARSTALELLQSLMDLHGAVLARLVELMGEAGEPGRALLAKLGSDPLICGLLVLYGVHPVDMEKRVRRALEEVQPRLKKQGGEVELTGISDAVVRVKIQSSGQGCGSSPDALQQTVEQAILEAAPEVVKMIVAESAASANSGFVPLNMIQPATKEENTYEKSAA